MSLRELWVYWILNFSYVPWTSLSFWSFLHFLNCSRNLPFIYEVSFIYFRSHHHLFPTFSLSYFRSNLHLFSKFPPVRLQNFLHFFWNRSRLLDFPGTIPIPPFIRWERQTESYTFTESLVWVTPTVFQHFSCHSYGGPAISPFPLWRSRHQTIPPVISGYR